jgi:hypothetical protein
MRPPPRFDRAPLAALGPAGEARAAGPERAAGAERDDRGRLARAADGAVRAGARADRGVYWLRLVQDGRSAFEKVVVLR